MIQDLMRRLVRELEMEEIEPAGGVYLFPLDEKTNVSIEEIEAGIVFSADLGPCPQKNQEKFFSDVLFANLYGGGTFYAVLGLNQDESRLTLTRRISLSSSYEDFRDALELFLNAAEFWRDEALEFERQT